MNRRETDRARTERLAWDRSCGVPLSGADRRFLQEQAAREAGAEESPLERVTVAVRRVTHGDPATATGAERRALFEEIMARRERPLSRSRVPLRSVGWAVSAVAALAVLLLVPRTARIGSDHGPAEHVAVRGGLDVLPSAGLGISGVDPVGGEYEVVHGDGLCPEDTLRFYLTVRDGRTPYYAVFGVQDVDDPIWYVPAPQDVSAPVLPEVPIRTWMVPFEIEVDGTHDTGTVSVVCLLSEEPISASRLSTAWAETSGDDIPARAAAAGAGLSAGPVRVLVEEFEILEACGRRP